MKVLIVAIYAWKKIARTHYLKALWGMAFFVAMGVLGTNTDATTAVAKLASVDLGIRLARTFTWAAAVWIGMSGLSGEIAGFTARTLLTKPVSRFQVALGLTAGGAFYLFVLLTVLLLEVRLLAAVRGIPLDGRYYLLCYSFFPPLVAVLALSQLVSMLFAKPITAFFMVGLSYENIWDSLGKSLEASQNPEWTRLIGVPAFRGLYLLSPTYQRFLYSYDDFLKLDLAWGRFFFHVGATFVYSAALCLLASALLSRKEI